MKCAVVNTADPAGTGTGTQFTDAGMSSVKLGLLLAAGATALNSVAAGATLQAGVTDGTNTGCVTFASSDAAAVGTAAANHRVSNTKLRQKINPSGTAAQTATLDSILATGYGLNYSAVGTLDQMISLILGGTDLDRAVMFAAFQAPVATTITAASSDIVSTNTFSAGDMVQFFGSFGTVTGLAAATTYYVIAAGLSGSNFRVSATSGGAAITPGGSGSATPTVGIAARTFTPGFQIDAIIVFSGKVSSLDTGTSGGTMSVGAYERAGGSKVGMAWGNASATNPTSLGAIAGDTHVGKMYASDGVTVRYTLDVANVTATTFDITSTSAGTNTCNVIAVALRANTGTFFGKAGVAASPTVPGSAAIGAAASGPTQVLLTFPTRLASANTNSNSTTAGAFGIGVAVNNAGVTQQGSVAVSALDGSTTNTQAKNVVSFSSGLRCINDDGSTLYDSAVNAWGGTGPTGAWGTVDASAHEYGYFHFGIAPPSGKLLALCSNQGGF